MRAVIFKPRGNRLLAPPFDCCAKNLLLRTDKKASMIALSHDFTSYWRNVEVILGSQQIYHQSIFFSSDAPGALTTILLEEVPPTWHRQDKTRVDNWRLIQGVRDTLLTVIVRVENRTSLC